MIQAKPFDIPKREVWLAWLHIRANQGAAGVDDQSIQDFEAQLAGNLFKLWNRLSSEAIFHRLYAGWTSPRQMVERGRWVFPRSPTALHRRLFADTSSH